MKYLCVDLGDRRTGLATGDDATRHAGPVGVIETSDRGTLLRAIAKAIDEHGAEALVVGVPLNMDDTPGPAAEKARQFARELEQRTGLPVHCVDERLTTFEADQQMRESGLTHRQKKARRDALAAAAMLSDFLASLP